MRTRCPAGLSLSLGVCAPALGGQRCSGPETRGPCAPSGRLFEGSGGAWAMVRRGAAGLGASEAAGFRGKRVSLGAEETGGVGGGGRVTAFSELTKAGCAGEFYAGSRSGIAGRRSLAALCGLRGCGRRRLRCRGWPASQFWETGLAAPGWTWRLLAPAARGTQALELPGMPSAVLKGRDAAEGAR